MITPPSAEELQILAELISHDRKLKEFSDVGLSRDAAKRRITALCRRYKVGRTGLGYLAGRYGWLDADPLRVPK